MLDDNANEAMEEVRRRGEALVEALNLTPVERQYAMAESEYIVNHITERYFSDDKVKGQKIRPLAVAAAVGFSLTYFDEWVTEMARKFPDLGK